MNTIIQIGTAILCVGGTVAILGLLVFSELSGKDTNFSFYFGILGTIAAISFFVMTRNDDNEETKPAEEKTKK